METKLIETDALSRQLAEAGFDLNEELTQIETTSNGIDLPRIRIEHKDNGKHRMYIDYGESYLDDESQEIPIQELSSSDICTKACSKRNSNSSKSNGLRI